MPKGYNEFMQYIITVIPTSTNMSSIKSAHVGLFQDRESEKAISPLYSLSKRGEDLYLFPNFSKLL